MVYTVLYCTQSRQSAKISLQSSELGLPHPLTRECAPPLWYRGEGHTRWRERGWQSPNFDEWTYTVVLYIYVYFVVLVPLDTICRKHGRCIIQYRIPSSSEETVYYTSSGLYPALSLEEAGNRAGGYVSPPSPYTSHPLASRRRHSFLPNFFL
jgi:hypothetical protein